MRARFTLSLVTLPKAFLRHLPIYTVINSYGVQVTEYTTITKPEQCGPKTPPTWDERASDILPEKNTPVGGMA